MYRPAIVRWPRIPLSNSRLYARILPACVSHAETRYPSRVFRVSTTIERISDTARYSQLPFCFHFIDAVNRCRDHFAKTTWRILKFSLFIRLGCVPFPGLSGVSMCKRRFTTYFSWTTVFASRNHLWTKSARKSDEGFDKVISTSEEKVIVEQGISFLKKKKLISLSMNSNNFTQWRCRLEITREKVERKYK